MFMTRQGLSGTGSISQHISTLWRWKIGKWFILLKWNQLIACFACNFLTKGGSHVQTKPNCPNFLSVRMYQLIFYSFPGVKLCGMTFEAQCMWALGLCRNIGTIRWFWWLGSLIVDGSDFVVNMVHCSTSFVL